jgi:hypothetical protein
MRIQTSLRDWIKPVFDGLTNSISPSARKASSWHWMVLAAQLSLTEMVGDWIFSPLRNSAGIRSRRPSSGSSA